MASAAGPVEMSSTENPSSQNDTSPVGNNYDGFASTDTLKRPSGSIKSMDANQAVGDDGDDEPSHLPLSEGLKILLDDRYEKLKYLHKLRTQAEQDAAKMKAEGAGDDEGEWCLDTLARLAHLPLPSLELARERERLMKARGGNSDDEPEWGVGLGKSRIDYSVINKRLEAARKREEAAKARHLAEIKAMATLDYQMRRECEIDDDADDDEADGGDEGDGDGDGGGGGEGRRSGGKTSRLPRNHPLVIAAAGTYHDKGLYSFVLHY